MYVVSSRFSSTASQLKASNDVTMVEENKSPSSSASESSSAAVEPTRTIESRDVPSSQPDMSRVDSHRHNVVVSNNDNDDDAASSAANHNQQTTERSTLGQLSVDFSETVNDNLIVARYTTMAAIGLLAAYGLGQTPLFFRYRNVAELPARLFHQRRTLTCRLVPAPPSTTTTHNNSNSFIHTTTTNYSNDKNSNDNNSNNPNNTIRLYLRHLSPIERILPRTWSDWLQLSDRHVWHVQLAGIQGPPDYYSARGERPGEWLDRLVASKATVRCQLLARFNVHNNKNNDDNKNDWWQEPKKRPLDPAEWNLPPPSLPQDVVNHAHIDNDAIAVVKLFYRPRPQVWPTDLAESLVRYGRAVPGGGVYQTHNIIMNDNTTTTTIVQPKDLRRDTAYMEGLARAEYQAAAASYGMWSDPVVRRARRDVMDEVDFQTRAPWWKKVLRWMQGG